MASTPVLAAVSPKIAIIGAGIGGLVTALHLHAYGFRDVDIFEAAGQLNSIGVGINVQPSAILVLRNLGLLPAMLATGIETQELNYYDQFGNAIISEPRGKFAGYTIPQISVHRGEFQMLLLNVAKERLGADRVHLNHALKSCQQVGNSFAKIKARFIERRTGQDAQISGIEADLIVACDGINSTVRKILYPNEGPPNFSGRMLWRGCVERDIYLTGASMVWSGHADQKFIAYPISKVSQRKGKSLVNWIAELRVRDANDPDTTPPEKTDWTMSVPKERFANAFKSWSFPFLNVAELIDSTEHVFEYPMCDRNPVDKWTFGRLTLLGDAAHAMYPIGSNGASQAILDAESLVKHLLSSQSLEDIPSALTAYQNERLPATAKIVMANRGNGPDHVMQLAHERAPTGFSHINDIIPQSELESIGLAYKAVAGFEIDKVNEAAVKTEHISDQLGLAPTRTRNEDS